MILEWHYLGCLERMNTSWTMIELCLKHLQILFLTLVQTLLTFCFLQVQIPFRQAIKLSERRNVCHSLHDAFEACKHQLSIPN
jgi:hypothetical protein